MTKATKNPEPEEPDDQEIERELAEERETKYGGPDRWFLTVAFVAVLVESWINYREKNSLFLFFVAMAVLTGVLAVINWRSWWKKSPEARAASRSANPFADLAIPDCTAPYTREQFLELRRKFGLNVVIAGLSFMFVLLGVLSMSIPDPKGRLIFLGMGLLGFLIGRHPAQRAWHAGKTCLACPTCHNVLTSQASYVLRTGHCRKCGTTILSGAPAVTPEEQPGESIENPASVSSAPAAMAEEQTLSGKRHRSHRHASWKPRNFQHDPKRLGDILALFACPIFCIYYFGWQRLGPGMCVLIGVMLLMMAGTFYWFPDKMLLGYDDSDDDDSETTSSENRPASGRAPVLDFAILLALPAAVIAGLFYLVWMNHALSQVELAVATIAIPAAVFLTSVFVVKHEGHHVKKSGRPAPAGLVWTLLAFWSAGTFIFVVLAFSWIQKYGLKW